MKHLYDMKKKERKKKRKGKKREAITSQLFFQHGGKIYYFTTWTSTGFSVPPFFSCPFLFINHTYVMEWLKKKEKEIEQKDAGKHLRDGCINEAATALIRSRRLSPSSSTQLSTFYIFQHHPIITFSTPFLLISVPASDSLSFVSPFPRNRGESQNGRKIRKHKKNVYTVSELALVRSAHAKKTPAPTLPSSTAVPPDPSKPNHPRAT